MPDAILTAIAAADEAHEAYRAAGRGYSESRRADEAAYKSLCDLLVAWCHEMGFEPPCTIVIGDRAFRLTCLENGEADLNDWKIHLYPGDSA